MAQKPKSRPRSGYQIFSSQVWVKVKTEMTSGNFAEVSREIGNQVLDQAVERTNYDRMVDVAVLDAAAFYL
jgi:hypothetical protein